MQEVTKFAAKKVIEALDAEITKLQNLKDQLVEMFQLDMKEEKEEIPEEIKNPVFVLVKPEKKEDRSAIPDIGKINREEAAKEKATIKERLLKLLAVDGPKTVGDIMKATGLKYQSICNAFNTYKNLFEKDGARYTLTSVGWSEVKDKALCNGVAQCAK